MTFSPIPSSTVFDPSLELCESDSGRNDKVRKWLRNDRCRDSFNLDHICAGFLAANCSTIVGNC